MSVTNVGATQVVVVNENGLNDALETKYMAFFDENGNGISLPETAADALLTGYTTTTGVHALSASDTVLAALAKIESRLLILEA